MDYSHYIEVTLQENVILFYWRNIEIVSGKKKKKVWFVLSSRDCINRHVHDSETLFEKKHSKIQTQGFDVEDLDNRIMIQIKKLFGFSLSVKC